MGSHGWLTVNAHLQDQNTTRMRTAQCNYNYYITTTRTQYQITRNSTVLTICFSDHIIDMYKSEMLSSLYAGSHAMPLTECDVNWLFMQHATNYCSSTPCWVFHLLYLLLVSLLLLKFVLPVHCRWCLISVKVGLWKPTTQDTIVWHIQPCTILTVGWGTIELVGCHRL